MEEVKGKDVKRRWGLIKAVPKGRAYNKHHKANGTPISLHYCA
jgi:hypothetical protein